ncbi:hypothetical protein FHG87_019420 [Trinorchestia longiramus]|nr:hypothetical protein FHG87_019420 [Trinorchestia longiramus]
MKILFDFSVGNTTPTCSHRGEHHPHLFPPWGTLPPLVPTVGNTTPTCSHRGEHYPHLFPPWGTLPPLVPTVGNTTPTCSHRGEHYPHLFPTWGTIPFPLYSCCMAKQLSNLVRVLLCTTRRPDGVCDVVDAVVKVCLSSLLLHLNKLFSYSLLCFSNMDSEQTERKDNSWVQGGLQVCLALQQVIAAASPDEASLPLSPSPPRTSDISHLSHSARREIKATWRASSSKQCTHARR